ncbi:uncharacterized protein LOC103473018 [Poecilia reticulata]|uniref:Uncharacterized LOC103473018 n=1 Tax=Poecilia reticulata TaxID=8081 RepID=A0A3P9NU64_POERE|nr:PREDICTED: uncharacterized protein LOC103473018 [Poecilia reticulata]
MKILLILVLVFLTGCNGGQYDHPSKSQVKMVQDAYWDYVQKSTMTPKDNVWDIRHSHPGQYLCSVISHSVEAVQRFFRLVYAHIVMWSRNFYHRFCQEVDHLQQHLHHFLHHLEDGTFYHATELVAQIRWKMESIKMVAAHYIEALDPIGLKMALLEKIKELNEHLNRCFELLETHHHEHHCDHHQLPGHHPGQYPGLKPPGHHHPPGHHGCGPETKKKINESMEAFKTSLFSLVSKFEVELAQTTEKINKKMFPLRKKPHGQLIKDSDRLKDDLESLWQDWLLLSQQKVV